MGTVAKPKEPSDKAKQIFQAYLNCLDNPSISDADSIHEVMVAHQLHLKEFKAIVREMYIWRDWLADNLPLELDSDFIQELKDKTGPIGDFERQFLNKPPEHFNCKNTIICEQCDGRGKVLKPYAVHECVDVNVFGREMTEIAPVSATIKHEEVTCNICGGIGRI